MAGIQTPEEAAKVKELEATLDFLKEKRPESSETPKGDNKSQNVVSGVSELDRARASRFAPPKHVLEQMAEKKASEAAEGKKEAGSEEKTAEADKSRAKPALHLAMTVDEAKKQGIIAPGSYGKSDAKADGTVGDTKEIPDVSSAANNDNKAGKKEKIAAPKPMHPIKNPLPIPKKHEAKDMDFDHDIPASDMHFDVVDMSGIDFFELN